MAFLMPVLLLLIFGYAITLDIDDITPSSSTWTRAA